MRITLSGTRYIEFPEHAYNILFDRFIEPYVEGSSTHFYIGGALGIDTKVLIWLCENFSRPDIKVVIPFTVSDQPKAAREAINKYRKRIKIYEMGLKKSKGGYLARDRWEVDRSHLVIAFPQNSEEGEGGTWYTIRYAERVGVPRLICPIREVVNARQ